IVPIEYDQFGREAKKRLPYVDTLSNSTGNYRPTAFADQMAFYANPGGSRWNAPAVASSTKPYATTLYEASPLNKVNEQGAPGMVWQPASTRNTADSGRTVLTEYATNNQVGLNTTPGESNKGSRKVAWYNAAIGNPGSAGNYMRTLERNSTPFYPSDSLSVTIVKDENWVKADGCLGTVEEYKDKEGHVVLKRTYNKTPDNQVEMLSTYYVHDDFGNLCFVLTPKADPDRADGMPSLTTIEQLCYQYRYDERQRLVLKRVAGKDWDALFYNKLNQLVCTQDGNQRNKASATQRQEASFTKYDALGRAIMTGTMTVPNTVNTASITTGRANIIAYINSTASLWETKTATGTGYSSTSFPTSEFIPLIMNYYDNHTDIPGLPAIYNQTSSKAGNTRGMLTATTVAVLNTLPALNTPTPVTVPDMLWSVTHYDDEGRVAVTYDQHYKGGIVDTANYDKVTYTYTFTGQADTTVRYHHIKKTSGASLQYTIGNTYKYDHAGRKIETGQQINDNNPGSPGGTPVYLSKLLYNELGQLKEKWSHRDPSMGGRYLGKTAYRYNIRGWLKSLTPVDTSGVLKPDDPFAEELWYNDPGAGYTPQFNGTISRFYNKAAYGFTGSFNYSYDKLNRLTSAIHADANLNETVVYDKMGNITSLTRNGPGNGTLTYTYANSGLSNKLASVTGSTGFTNLTNRTYTYDVNGNALKADSGKTIAYNLLNLPQTVKNSGGTTLATYVYDATGKKLRNISTGGGTTEYVDGIVYTNGVIEYIQTEEGRALVATGGNLFYYQYDFKDYLGNVRGSYQKNTATIPEPALVQEDEYYAFGLRRNIRNSPNNSYLYNGKEIQTDLTDQYDYGARFYDPVIARWNTIDPLAEQMRRYSPYNYVFDNPVNLIDPDGMGPGPAPMVFGVKLDWASAWASSYDEGGDYRNFKTKQKKEISANSEAILKGSLEKDKKAAGSGKGYSNQRPIWYKPWIFETEYTANSMHVNTSYNLNTARTEVTPFTTDENVSKLIQGNIGLTGGKGTKYLLSVLQGLGFLKSDIASSRLSDLIGVGVGWISDVGFRYQDVTTSVDAEKWFGKVRFNGVNGSIIGVEYYGSQTIRMPINSYRIEQIFNTKTGKVLFQGTINRSFSIPKSSNQLPKFNYGKFD
ncbi:MAG: RHS repeat-associated core domain-containing protein, partial [Sphingobacteriales bacterium]